MRAKGLTETPTWTSLLAALTMFLAFAMLPFQILAVDIFRQVYIQVPGLAIRCGDTNHCAEQQKYKE